MKGLVKVPFCGNELPENKKSKGRCLGRQKLLNGGVLIDLPEFEALILQI